MHLRIDILRGHPDEAELAALTTAVWAWLQAQTSSAPPPAITASAWQRSGLLKRSGLLNTTALGGWPLRGSTWECSERLTQSWQS